MTGEDDMPRLVELIQMTYALLGLKLLLENRLYFTTNLLFLKRY